jgi:hypothetical protein
VGSARQNAPLGGPPGYLINSTFFDSPENQFTYNQWMKPRTPRDVVWLVNKATVSTELPFDDYLNPDSFIVSVSGAAYTMSDGFRLSTQVAASFTGPKRLQNAATAKADRWVIPSFGAMVGPGRIEPVALGGIHGKGLWLQPTTGVRYGVLAQPQAPAASDWYASVFVDPRFADDGVRREIFSF